MLDHSGVDDVSLVRQKVVRLDRQQSFLLATELAAHQTGESCCSVCLPAAAVVATTAALLLIDSL